MVSPEGLIGIDHVGFEGPPAQRPVGRFEMPGEHADLIPDGLAVDVEACSAHGHHLALERQVVEVLALGDMDCEVDRVPATRDELRRARRRHDLFVAPAAVLLPTVFQDLVLDTNDGDLLGLLGLVAHLGEGLAANGAGTVLLCESVDHLFDGQIRLAFGTVAAAWFLGLVGSDLLVARSSLGGFAEDHSLHGGELFLEELELHLRIDILTSETSVFGA